MKRLFDFIVALLLSILLLPVVLMVALLIIVTMGWPVLFIQQRPGIGGKPFCIYKFRTMNTVYDENGVELPDQARITRTGQLLRKLSLDELPQLFNVLKGELSIVGPRPLLMEYLPLYTADQARRHDVLPGITGWAQVNGRNAISWEERFELDIWYVDNQSFCLDMKIILMTLGKLFKSDDISQAGHATMPKFEGTLKETLKGTKDNR